MKLDKTISMILLVLLVILIAATVYITVNPKSGEKFTEFYILGQNGQAGNYPTNLTVNETGNVTVGIVNREQSTTDYNLIVIQNNTVYNNQTFTLQKNETTLILVSFTPSKTGNNTKLEFLLYKLPNSSDVYRSLNLVMNVN